MSKIDYDLTLIKAVAFDIDGVLSPATIPMDAEGTPLRMVNVRDGYALQLAVKQGIKIAVITGADSKAVEVRYSGLGITDIFTRAAHKVPLLHRWMETNSLDPTEVAYMGDDIPDLMAMREVGLPCCPADACPDIKGVARYISPVMGGYGVGRDLLEQILRAKGLWMADAKAFGW
ncbi:MAG: HAD hydrolase-like protein [Pseudoflavonifractor sp.]|nr:HAD hydrolase-like protein [Alloprevotella sp.]MCM1116744.1 HAD hydrolase-like protein [Pseudoflavonifractor sp.]